MIKGGFGAIFFLFLKQKKILLGEARATMASVRHSPGTLGHSGAKIMIYTQVLTKGEQALAIHLTGFEAIEEVIMSILIRCRDKGVASIQRIDISRILAIGRRDAISSYTGRKPNLRILCGSI